LLIDQAFFFLIHGSSRAYYNYFGLKVDLFFFFASAFRKLKNVYVFDFGKLTGSIYLMVFFVGRFWARDE